MTTTLRERPSESRPPDHEASLLGAGGRYQSMLHDSRVAAWLGIALGVTFGICFVTGVISHLVQHPPSWFTWPSRPAGLYRFTQGLHVITGIASIPVFVAKLWVVAPRFWALPPVKGIAHAVERLMLFPLVGGGAFMLFSGVFNTFQWYPWTFNFTKAHYGVAYITIGGLIGHIAAKGAVTLAALRGEHHEAAELTAVADAHDRRLFLGGVAAAAGAITLATAGQTIRPLRAVSMLAPRDPGAGPQGVPVNRTAKAAHVTDDLVGDAYRLVIRGKVDREVELTLADLQALPQHSATLPISCVEGWSASARWRGVRLRDVLARAGVEGDVDVTVESLQTNGNYASSEVAANVVADRDTLLALELEGEPLDRDHGFPLRLIAPNRPGVMQTKWVHQVVVR